eukprot:9372-Heterococcus_DN1.PRE.2
MSQVNKDAHTRSASSQCELNKVSLNADYYTVRKQSRTIAGQCLACVQLINFVASNSMARA